ncbi:MAG: preprotein translocase subunit SecE [Deltaproteobacteria bacterium]|nr:preprotein translocase subunit SecE [Deltaproteobacteria bacterium]
MEKIKLIINRVRRFLKEARVELKKVTWPTPKEALASTSVVIVVVIILSLFLGVVDLGLTRIIRLVLG